MANSLGPAEEPSAESLLREADRDSSAGVRRSRSPDSAAASPRTGSLLRALREQARRATDPVRIRDMDAAEYVRSISYEISVLTKFRMAESDESDALGVLLEQTRRPVAPVSFREVGTVQHIGDGVATLSGLRTASTDELVTFPTGIQGLILNLDPDGVDVILLGQEEGIRGGDLVTSTNQRLQVPVGPALTGRVVNPLGEPLDERGPVLATESALLERVAPGIVDRAPVDTPLHTGLKMIDALVPIGRGQRELIVGDRQTGKTSLAVDTILNQTGGDVACVYVAIGQKKSSTAATIETLRQANAMLYTTVVVAGPDDPPALRYLAPYAGAAIAEFLMYEGRDVLIVYDDLTKHADAYRELSLLLRRPPGREAYPGDMFYAHARLLERACRLSDSNGGGSLTALPIVEMQRGNVASYILTNLISICDGQIVLDSGLFNRGLKPAVDVGRSVSRVAGAAQTAAMRAVAGTLRLDLSQFEEVARFARFGTEVDDLTRRQIRRGERLRIALMQPLHQTLSLAAQVLLLQAVTQGLFDDLPLGDVAPFEAELVAHFEAQNPELVQDINQTGELPTDIRHALIEATAALRPEADPAGAGPTVHPAAPEGSVDASTGIAR